MNDRDNDMLGWIGAGTAFALMMQVAPFRWAVYVLMLWLADMAAQDWMSEHQLRPGDPADFVLFDPDLAWVATAEALLSKGKNTPCLDKEVPGRVMSHYLGGRLVFSRM